ncbi:MAG TPA: amidase family protein, partial [Candidatus Thermoplasmatota archaeon]
GSIALANNLPVNDATITARLRDAGAIILGKAQLSEFANWVDLSMPSGYSSLGGQVINAYNWSRTPSGSSSGSGVLTSMALSAGSIGSETSGSILSPSNANSNVGLKPTMGLLSRAGIIPLAENFDVPGPMVRNVYDAAAMLGAMAGEPDPLDPETRAPPNGDYIAAIKAMEGVEKPLAGVRLGYVNAGSTIFEEARTVLTELGAEVVQIQTNQLTGASTGEIALIPQEFHQGINDYLLNTERQKPLDIVAPDLGAIILYNSQHPDKVKYGQGLIIASEPNAGFGGAFVKPAVDALALPVVTAARAGADKMFDDHNVDAIIGQNAPHTGLGAAAGYPTVVVPSGYSGDGTIPVGISFFGKAFTEDKLLAYAYAYEQATHKRTPPTVQNPANLEGVCGGRTSASGPGGLEVFSDPEFPTETDFAREFFADSSSRDGLLELP